MSCDVNPRWDNRRQQLRPQILSRCLHARSLFLLSKFKLITWISVPITLSGRKVSEMAAEPSEEAIENFVSFTSTTREQAISFLKVSGLRSILDNILKLMRLLMLFYIGKRQQFEQSHQCLFRRSDGDPDTGEMPTMRPVCGSRD